MKLSQALIVCVCLLGATQLVKSQVKESAAHGIPGTLDPATGKFTTRLGSANTQTSPEVAGSTASTSVLFREDFHISITNYDQSGTTAVCSVDLTGGDAGGSYEEEASVSAAASGGTFSCDVPILTQWSLQTPTTDSVYAAITVTIYTAGSATGAFGTPTVYRMSTRSLTLTQPGNTQTVVNNVNFTL
jgi:hypothetical protein